MIGTGTTLAADARGVESLRAAAARDPRAAIKEAAKQFEGLFMHELMKSMRQATQTSGVPGDSTTQLGTEMLDTQFAQQMTGLRGGLSEAIARHLERQLGIAPGAAAGDVTSDASSLVNPTKLPLRSGHGLAPWPTALDPSAPVDDAGSMSRAGSNPAAQGLAPVAPGLSAGKVGFVQPQAQATRAAQQASAIPAHFSIAQELQRAGDTTDPHHADQLTRTLNTTLRAQRAVA